MSTSIESIRLLRPSDPEVRGSTTGESLQAAGVLAEHLIATAARVQ